MNTGPKAIKAKPNFILRKKSFKLSILFSTICITGNLSLPVQGQPGTPANWHTRHIGQEEGLSQNSIKCLAIDNKGYVWIGTENGIVRFDGLRIKSYNNIKLLQQSGIRIRGIIRWKTNPDSDTLFAITNKGKALAIYDGDIKKVINYSDTLPGETFLNDQYYMSFPTWDTRKKYILRHAPDWNIETGEYKGFYLGGDTLGICVNDGIGIYNEKGLLFKHIIKDFQVNNVARHGNLILYLNNDNSTLSWYNVNKMAGTISLPAGHRYHLLQDAQNKKAWLANNQALFAFVYTENGKAIIQKIINNFNPGSPPNMLLQVNDRILLTGTVTNGLWIYNKHSFVTSILPSDMETDVSNSMYAQLPMPHGNSVLSGSKFLFAEGKYMGELPSMNNSSRFTFLKDCDNYYWYGLSTATGVKLVKTKYPGKNEETVAEFKDQIKVIFEDSNRSIWIATGKGAIIRIKTKTTSDLTYISRPVDFHKIDFLTESTNKKYLLMATDNGIYQLNKDAPETGITCTGLRGNNVRFILADEAGIWACTYGQGLYLIQENTKQVHAFPTDTHYYLNTVHSFIKDKNGKVWLPTNNGLFVTTYQSLLDYCKDNEARPFYYFFDKSSGFKSNEFNGGCQPSFLALPNDWYTLSSLNGIVWLHPDQTPLVFPSGDFSIKTIITNKDTVNQLSGNTLQLAKGTHYINIEVDYLYWGHPENNILEYSLTTDEDRTPTLHWYEVPPDHMIRLNYLTHGNYTLKIRSRTGFDQHSFSCKGVSFHIKPYWYRSNFLYLIIVLVIGLAFLLISYVLKQNNINLQKRIDEATTNLNKSNITLTHRNELLKRLITIFNHDISLPLIYIYRFLSHKVKHWEASEADYKDIEQIYEATGQLVHLTDNLLEWVKIQGEQSNLQIKWEEIDLAQFLKQQLNPFLMAMNKKQIESVFHCDNNLTLNTDPNILSIIIYNLLNNAVKHVYQGKITLNAVTENNHVLINIEDTGKGMKIGSFTPGSKSVADNSPLSETGHGLGWQIVNDLARAINTEISIDSKEGAGTCVSLKFKRPMHKHETLRS